VSITAVHTMHCERGRSGGCTETVTSDGSIKDLREEATELGWHVNWGVLPLRVRRVPAAC
jgi:hypothetical protein